MSLVAYVDTNVLLRYCLNDLPEHTPAATRIVNEADELRLLPTILLEVGHVLRSNYGFSRPRIAETLLRILALPAIVGEVDAMAQAVRLHIERSIDLEDAWLAVTARSSNAPRIASFDRDFDRVAELERVSS